MHPSLAPLVPLFKSQQLAIVHGAGSAGYDALAFRCAGLHGVRHAGHEGDRRWLAESHAGKFSLKRTLRRFARWPWERTCRHGLCAVWRQRSRCRTSSSSAYSRSRRRWKAASRRSTRNRWIWRCAGRAREDVRSDRHVAQGRSFEIAAGKWRAMYPNGRVGQTMQNRWRNLL